MKAPRKSKTSWSRSAVKPEDDMKEYAHTSVLLHECIEALNIKPDGIYVDGTLGGGGHSLEIAKRLNKGRLLCIDQDEAAIAAASKRLANYRDKIIFVKDNFSNIRHILENAGIERIDGALLDLGVSSYQLDTPERGFSYNADAPLDMRMNADAAFSAYNVVNTYTESELFRVFTEYGEEPNARRIAAAVVKARAQKPVETTTELVDIIKSVTPKKLLAVGHHPAKKSLSGRPDRGQSRAFHHRTDDKRHRRALESRRQNRGHHLSFPRGSMRKARIRRACIRMHLPALLPCLRVR